MKRLLLAPILLVLALPVMADWQKLVYDESYSTFKRNYDNGFKFAEIEDTEMACRSFKLANDELKNHFAILQKYNSSDWFVIRANLKKVLDLCNK